MKKTYLLASFLISAQILSAQITWDIGDFMKAGFNRDYYEASSNSVSIGSAGANSTFDFSNSLAFVYDTFNVDFVDPSSTPYATNHPTASLAYRSDYEEDSATGQVVFEQWNFVITGTQGSAHTGVTLRVDTGALFSNNPPTSLIDVHASYQNLLMVIANNYTYPSTNGSNGYWDVTLGNLKHSFTKSRSVEADAYGTLKNPWRDFDAIRFKVLEIESGIDSVNGQHDDSWSDTIHSFEYWIKGLGYYAAKVYTDDSYTNAYDVEFVNQKGPVGIPEQEKTPEYSLFPVPAKDVLTVQLNSNEAAQYRIIDMNGKEILLGKIRASQKSKTIDINNLTKGIYLFELTTDSGKKGSKPFIVE